MKDFFHLSNELKSIYEISWPIGDDRLNLSDAIVTAAEKEMANSINLEEVLNTLRLVDY